MTYLSELHPVIGLNVLDGLSVSLEDVHSHNGVVELWVRRFNQLVVEMFLIAQGIETCREENRLIKTCISTPTKSTRRDQRGRNNDRKNGSSTFEDKVEDGLQVLGTWRSDEDVGVREGDGSSDGDTQRSRFASTTSSSKSDCVLESLL